MLNIFPLFSLIFFAYNKAIKIKRPNPVLKQDGFNKLLPTIFFIFPLLFSCCKNRGLRRGFCIAASRPGQCVTDLLMIRASFGPLYHYFAFGYIGLAVTNPSHSWEGFFMRKSGEWSVHSTLHSSLFTLQPFTWLPSGFLPDRNWRPELLSCRCR